MGGMTNASEEITPDQARVHYLSEEIGKQARAAALRESALQVKVLQLEATVTAQQQEIAEYQQRLQAEGKSEQVGEPVVVEVPAPDGQ